MAWVADASPWVFAASHPSPGTGRGDRMQEDIGQMLLDAQLIDSNALQKAQQQQKSAGGSLSASLVKVGAISEEGLLEFLSRTYHASSVDLRNYEPDPTLTRVIP